MKVKEAIRLAIIESNHEIAGRIVDKLRFTYGLNHQACYQFFRRNAPNPEQYRIGDFEALMMEADTTKEQG